MVLRDDFVSRRECFSRVLRLPGPITSLAFERMVLRDINSCFCFNMACSAAPALRAGEGLNPPGAFINALPGGISPGGNGITSLPDCS